MDMVATQNFRSVGLLLGSPAPQAAAAFAKLGEDDARMLLRHQVSEQNRWYFETWGAIEVAISASLLLVLLLGSIEKQFSLLLALLMMLVAIVQRFLLTPRMIVLGRLIDWVPVGDLSDDRSRFWELHNAFVGLEILNWLLALLLGLALIFRTRGRTVNRDTDFAALR